jgi:hypothetical protein
VGGAVEALYRVADPVATPVSALVEDEVVHQAYSRHKAGLNVGYRYGGLCSSRHSYRQIQNFLFRPHHQPIRRLAPSQRYRPWALVEGQLSGRETFVCRVHGILQRLGGCLAAQVKVHCESMDASKHRSR